MNNEIVHGFDGVKNEAVNLRLQVIDGIPHCLAIYATGYLDTYNADFYFKRVMLAIEAGYTRIILDMHGITYMSSAAYGTLTSILKAVRAREGDLVLARVQSKVYEVCQLLGLASYFNFANSVPEAASFLADKSVQGMNGPFPRVVPCLVCERRLLARKAGLFRCPECKTVITIDNHGRVELRDALAPAVMRHSR